MSAGGGGHGPRVRPFLLGLVVVLALFLIADGLASLYAERRVAGDLQQSADLAQRPTVEIHGTPFLAQALSGRYERIDVEATDVDLGNGLRAERLSAVLEGVRVPLGDALAGGSEWLPVERLRGEGLLTFDDLEERVAPDAAETLELSAAGPDGDLVRVEAQVRLLGREVTVTTDSEVQVVPDGLEVTAGRITLGDGEGVSEAAESVLNGLTGGDLDFTVPFEGLPEGIDLREVEVLEEGLVAVVGGEDVVLDRGLAGGG